MSGRQFVLTLFALAVVGVVGWALGRSGRPFDPEGCHDCADVVGRLSAELAKECAKVAILSRALLAHQAHIDHLEARSDVVAEAEQITRGDVS